MDKISVSVGIAAYNEGANIKNLLTAILSQRQENFELLEILVVSDGSTDNTAEEVGCLNHPAIKFIGGQQREGKARRHNQIFSLVQGEVVVLFDGDILIRSPKVIEALVKPFMKDKRIGLVGGDCLPLLGQTWVEKAINTSIKAYQHYRTLLKRGNNVFNSNGPVMAMSKALAKQIKVPETVIAEDNFLYFQCLTSGFKFKYAPKAQIFYRLPTSLRDHLRQNKRFLSGRALMIEIFGERAKKEYRGSLRLKWQSLFHQFLKEPLPGLTIFTLNLYCHLYCRLLASSAKGGGSLWSVCQTTKGGLKNA